MNSKPLTISRSPNPFKSSSSCCLFRIRFELPCLNLPGKAWVQKCVSFQRYLVARGTNLLCGYLYDLVLKQGVYGEVCYEDASGSTLEWGFVTSEKNGSRWDVVMVTMEVLGVWQWSGSGYMLARTRLCGTVVFVYSVGSIYNLWGYFTMWSGDGGEGSGFFRKWGTEAGLGDLGVFWGVMWICWGVIGGIAIGRVRYWGKDAMAMLFSYYGKAVMRILKLEGSDERGGWWVGKVVTRALWRVELERFRVAGEVMGGIGLGVVMGFWVDDIVVPVRRWELDWVGGGLSTVGMDGVGGRRVVIDLGSGGSLYTLRGSDVFYNGECDGILRYGMLVVCVWVRSLYDALYGLWSWVLRYCEQHGGILYVIYDKFRVGDDIGTLVVPTDVDVVIILVLVWFCYVLVCAVGYEFDWYSVGWDVMCGLYDVMWMGSGTAAYAAMDCVGLLRWD
ncbi:hypothetical protein Tco_1514843 [Tanacetum coccineum]